MSTIATLTVLEGGKPLVFTFDDLMRYHGPGFPGGVAHAFAAMRAAFPLLDDGNPLERREISVRTAFRGPGGHDALEMVTRGRSEGRQHIAAELAEPERGQTLQNYVFEFSYRGALVTVHVAEDIVWDEFITLGKKPGRTEEENKRLEWLKTDMARRILDLPPEQVYRPVPTHSPQ
ncbi:MAG: hypothetical protein ABS76_00775 [Pelagibacterium sp. SCN 64-44]|mgnify:CR=1 FL=1|nr:MAG: hypothetical protein ABS76_00775 [Pelagibacterium sp. SCN 64-44]